MHSMPPRRRRGWRLAAPWLACAVLVLGVGPVAGPVAAADGRSDGVVEGTVTAQGAPVADAWVRLTPVNAAGGPAGPPATAFTDAAGRYVLDSLQHGSATLLVRSPPGAGLVDTWFPGTYTQAEATPITVSARPVRADVTLPRAGSASGRVVDEESGDPVPGARVVAEPVDAPGRVGLAQAAERPGAFALTGLPPRDLRLRVELPEDSPYLAAGGPVIDGRRESTGLTLTVQRGAEIRGTVRDDRGAPVAGALVRLIGCGSTCPQAEATGASGEYRIRGVSPGARLGVTAGRAADPVRRWFPDADRAAGAARLRVRSGQVLEPVDLTLPRASFLSVQVAGSSIDEPLHVVARLSGADRTWHQYISHRPDEATTGSPVVLRVGPVPAGDYSLRLTPGAPEVGKLPTRWVTEKGSDAPRGLTLLPGEEARTVAALPSRAGSGDSGRTGADRTGGAAGDGEGTAACDRPGSGSSPRPGAAGAPGAGPADAASGSTTWPGLHAGFLSPEPGWWSTTGRPEIQPVE